VGLSFSAPVHLYMSAPVHTIEASEDLRAAQLRLDGLAVSSLAVLDGDRRLVGVISRTDLIRVGRRQAGSRGKAALLTLPEKPISRRMSSELVTIGPDETLTAAARKMVDQRLHRLFVVGSDGLVGVISTRDIMLAIRDKRVNKPISDWMSKPVFTVRAEEPISLATERLEKAHVTGLAVVDDGWPVGVFTQREALDARNQPRDTRVEDVMDAAMLALEVDTPLHRAAAQAEAMRVRRIIAVKGRRLEGILTGLDFARAAI
jgi:predicted transcriptional regulator